MSTPGHTDDPDTVPGRGGTRANVAKALAAVAAAALLAFGANAISNSGSSASGALGAQGAPTPSGAQGAPAAPPTGGAPPAMGTTVTGATLSKLTAVATARYPGTVERAMKLADGSYVVHVLRSGGEAHVLVSRDFKVTGVDRGGPPGGVPPAGSAPRGGAAPGTRS